jgi:hypothetical protein
MDPNVPRSALPVKAGGAKARSAAATMTNSLGTR